jgi:ABC-type multidrug transport system ATPase subunit
MHTSKPIVEVRNLVKNYKEFRAVDNVSFTVYEKDIFAFLGPNGAGKSTSIRMMLGLIFPDQGSIKIFEKDFKENQSHILKRVGAIVEKPDFYLSLSAYKNLEILGKLQGGDTSKSNIMKVLEWVGLETRATSKVKTFSQGMKQRLGIAQTLVHDPSLIVLDEPTNGLDPQGMVEVREMILKLNRELNKTIIISSHILNEVELIANRMVIINKGKTIVEGNVTELLEAGVHQVSFYTSNNVIASKLASEKNIKTATQNQDFLSVEILDTTQIAQLNALFVQNNIDVYSISKTRNLEAYFLSLT